MRSFITATEIAERLCFPRRDGQGILPQLVEKLITCSVRPEAVHECRFPHGDQVQLHGTDGILAVAKDVKHPYVPSGLSVWEMGTSMDPKSKADEDFSKAEKKLVNAFPAVTPQVTTDKATFVFVTSKSWESGEWIREHKKTTKWKDVCVVDAVGLERWLEQSPAVMLWFADICGIPAEGLFDAEQYLSKMGISFGAALTPELALAGRDEKLAELRDGVTQSDSELHLRGESVEEAAAFLAASSLKEPKAFGSKPPLVFAESRADLNLLATFGTEITLVPLDTDALAKVKGLRQTGWRVIVPEVATTVRSHGGQDIVLGRCKRGAVEGLLVEQMDLSEHKARQVTRDSKGSLIALLWLIGSGPIGVPRWASRKDATTHASLILAGSWIGSNASDTAVIERLSRKDYRGIETLLQSALVPEGPWIHRGVEWMCVSREFVWGQLASRMTETMLTDFHEAVREVVGETNPALDLPPSERHMASILGKQRKHSDSLRRGLMDSVARLALIRADGQSWADGIVHDLLEPKSSEETSRWPSLVDVYSQLAEAAPRVFLDCLDDMLERDATLFFQDQGGANLLFAPTSPHVYLLWALECLAWQKEHFPRVLFLLAKMAAADPGGHTSNRPTASLVTILLPWSPQHSESMEKAVEALEMLYRSFPAVAWEVAARLLPTSWSVTSGTSTPEYRPFGGTRSVTPKERWQFIRTVVEKMIDWADAVPARLARLVEAYPELHKGWSEVGDLVTSSLGEVDVTSFRDDDKVIVHKALRELVAHHREHEDAEWALPEPALRSLEALQTKFTPSDVVLRCEHLFSWDPDVPDAPMKQFEEGWDEWLQEKQAEAIETVYEREGLGGVLRLAERAVLPQYVGQAAASLQLEGDVLTELLRRTLCGNPADGATDSHLQCGRSYVWAKYRNEGEAWLDSVLSLPGISWTPEMRANLALGMPPSPLVWERLAQWGSKADRLYWQNLELRSRMWEHWPLVLKKWTEVARPWSSIELISHIVDDRRPERAAKQPSADEVMAVLEQALQADEDTEPLRRRGQMLPYYIERIFGYLDSLDIPAARLAPLEWGWLRILEDTDRGAHVLQEQITSDPELFVELLKAVFRAEGEHRDEASSDDQARIAEQAYRVLHGIRTIPGYRAAETGVGSVDAGALQKWVAEARRLARDADRLDVCDSQIGEILSCSPDSPDGTWPCREVRDLIEEVQSAELENGLRIGKYNQRGAVTRGKGGKQEWDLAEKYQTLAEKIRTQWPRTASALETLAKQYENEARHWDEQAKWQEYE